MAKQNIAAAVYEAALPVVQSCGVNLWDLQFVKEGADRILRFTIDKPGGVSIEDCERVHRAVDPIIDKMDPIQESYYMEVSSPGLGRRLIRPEHFELKAGETVALRLIRPDENGLRDYRGSLISGGDTVKISTPEGEKEFAASAVSYVKLCDDEDLF